MNLLIENGIILTLDKERRILKNGAVIVEGDVIKAVGKANETVKTFHPQQVINAENKIVMPGLIDCHSHVVSSLGRGFGDDVDLFTWLYDRSFPFQAALTKEDAYVSSLLGCLEMIKTGTTCFVEPGHFLAESAARAVEETGIRAVLAERYMDTIADTERPQPKRLMVANVEEAIKRYESFFQEYNGAADGRIRVWFSMGDPRGSSDGLLVAIKRLAEKFAVGVQIHVAGNKEAVDYFRQRKGVTEVEFLHKLGILGSDMLIIHAGWLTAQEVELVRQYDVKVCHCPGASMHSAQGSCFHGKFPELIKGGVTICLGTDVTSNNNSLDMFRAMYQAATCHKESRMVADLVSPEQSLEMATINGARSIMWDDQIGSIEVGKKADIILVDTKKPHWLPLQDFSLVPTLVYSGDGMDVDTVIIDGKIVMANKELKTVNEKEILEKAQRIGVNIFKKAGLYKKLKPRWPVIAL